MGHPSMPPTSIYPSPCSKKSRSSQIQPYTPNGKWRRIVDDLQCEVDVNTVMFMLYVGTWDLLMQPDVLLDREQLHYTSVHCKAWTKSVTSPIFPTLRTTECDRWPLTPQSGRS